MSQAPTRICLKKQKLQEAGYESLKDWVYTRGNVYVTNNKKKYVKNCDEESKWQNPFPIWMYGIDESLRLYEEMLRNDEHLVSSIPYLAGRVLGCWCSEDDNSCHSEIIIKIFNEFESKRNRKIIPPPSETSKKLKRNFK